MVGLSWLVWLLLSFLIPSTTLACGGFFCEPQRPVVQSGEAIVFGVNGNQVEMHVQILYEGPAEAFSWVLPLPVQPDEISVGSDLLFSSLFQETLPQWELEILDDMPTDTCDSAALEPNQCLFSEDLDAEFEEAPREVGGEATVLDQGSVGPFDYVILEAAENNPSSVLDWLNDNGYDQPEGSGPLLNYYAVNNHVFVALKLQKQAETGEIQPLIISYTMPGDLGTEPPTTVARRAMACVPIQLTRIAATDNMPIQVYILGQGRAVPLNFVEIELDENQARWLNCQFNPSCYYDDFMDRFDAAASQFVNHSFVTEYAGSSALLADTIEIQGVTEEDLAQATSIFEFDERYRFRLPRNLPLVDTIAEDFRDSEPFNATGLAAELEQKVLKPAREAQAFVDGFPYLTRMYARLSPDYMTKDPFFAFKPELPDVNRTRRATGTPVCSSPNGFLEPTAMIIQAEGQSSTIEVPVSRECGNWLQTPGPVLPEASSTALAINSWGFTGDDGVVVLRNDDGSFDSQAIDTAIGFGDSLVMDQTIPEYTSTDSGGTTPSSTSQPNPGATTSTDPPSPAATESPPTDAPTSKAWKSQKLSLLHQALALLGGFARFYF